MRSSLASESMTREMRAMSITSFSPVQTHSSSRSRAEAITNRSFEHQHVASNAVRLAEQRERAREGGVLMPDGAAGTAQGDGPLFIAGPDCVGQQTQGKDNEGGLLDGSLGQRRDLPAVMGAEEAARGCAAPAALLDEVGHERRNCRGDIAMAPERRAGQEIPNSR
jgi:hypothetical protein